MSKYAGNTVGMSDGSWREGREKGRLGDTQNTNSNNITSEGLYLKPGPFARTRIFLTIVEGDSLTAELRNCLAWFRKVSKAGAAVL